MLRNSLDCYVVSTEVRMCRNFKGHRFVPTLGRDEADLIDREASAFLSTMGFQTVSLINLSDREIEAMQHRRWITDVKNRAYASFAKDDSGRRSVLINDDDHLLLQGYGEGLCIEKVFRDINALDDAVGRSLKYAYDQRLGYLTVRPCNVGTGLRASIIMFLPALSLSQRINELSAGNALVEIRSLSGDASDGYLYRVTNRRTLGLSEKEIFQELTDTVEWIAEEEERAREILLNENPTTLPDRIYRAWGLLTNSYVMTDNEAVGHLAFVKLGAAIGLIKLRDLKILDSLSTECRSAVMTDGKTMDGREIDLKRAKLLRDSLTTLRLV